MSIIRINSLGITDGTIVNADINSAAAIATTKLGAGAVLQVVSATKTDTTSLTSTTYTDITGLSVSITPSSASNKILIVATVTTGGTTGAQYYRIVRDSTAICVGDAASSRTPVSLVQNSSSHSNGLRNITQNFLDSPNTTSATTYKIQWRVQNSPSVTIYLNRSSDDSDTESFGRGASSITVMEIKG